MIAYKKVTLLTITILSLLSASLSTPAETFTWKNVNIGGGGGFVPNIIYNTTQPGLVYARTDMGGLYRRDSVSGKWIPLTDWVAPEEWNMLGGEAFATDPVDPKICYFAAGTYTNDWTDMNGRILRSRDYGTTWQAFEMSIKFGGNMPGRGMGERLAIDPNSNNILYFGARSGKGLLKSENSGETWTKVSSFPVTGDYVQDPTQPYTADAIGVVWISFDKSSSVSGKATSRIFVGVAQKSGPTVYQSNDAGATWSAIEGQPLGPDTSHIMPHHGVVRDSVIYIPYCNKGGPYDGNYGEIWKYNFQSSTWTDITPHTHLQDEAGGTTTLQKDNAYFGYGGFDVDYKNPDIIIAATLNSWWPDAVLFKSTDGGATWTKSFYWTSYPSAKFKYDLETTFPWLNWGTKTQRWPDVVQPKIGWMISGIALNPFNSNEFMYGTGATIYGTKNFGDWGDSTKKVQIKSVANGIEECAVLSLTVPPITSGTGSNVKLVSGVGDIGGFAHTDLQTPTQMFQTPAFGTTNSIDYAELDPKQVVRVGAAAPVQYETPCHIANSTDGGLSWNKIYVTLDTTYKSGTVAMSAKGSSILWAAEGKVPYCGSFYGLKATDLPAGVWVASDRVDDSAFYAFKDSIFYKGNGASFSKSSTRLSFPASKIKAVPGFKGHVWLPAGKSGLWFTEDGGTTFKQIDTTKVRTADIIGFGKAAPSATYPAIYITGKIANKTGVFMSKDQGGSWQRINDDAHQYGSINYTITGDMRQYGIVFVGTNGRGIVYGTASGSSNLITNKKIVSSNKIMKYGSVITVSGKAILSLYDMKGRLIRIGNSDGVNAKVKLSGLSKGVYIAHSGMEAVQVMIR